MSAVPKYNYLTPEEYLAIERAAEYKSEYIDGVMYAMAGGSPKHSLISGNVLTELNVQLKDSPCLVFNSDLKVRVPSSRRFHYPDVIVVCDKPEYADDEQDVLLNPLLLVEVLSKSTAGYDRRQKFLYYQELESFREYLLIAQDEPLVLHHVKQPNGTWIVTRIAGLEQNVELLTIKCRLPLKDIYAKVTA
jgi:Uma2 family endonuclease